MVAVQQQLNPPVRKIGLGVGAGLDNNHHYPPTRDDGVRGRSLLGDDPQSRLESLLQGMSAGALGESIATSRLLRRGYTVLLPITPEPYDMVASAYGRYVRIQVKSTGSAKCHRAGVRYSFTLKHSINRAYPAGSVDFFVMVALDTESCWVIPANMANVKSCKINPNRRGKWSRYIEAWHLLQ